MRSIDVTKGSNNNNNNSSRKVKGRILNVTVWFALRGELRVAFSVSAVVVNKLKKTTTIFC